MIKYVDKYRFKFQTIAEKTAKNLGDTFLLHHVH